MVPPFGSNDQPPQGDTAVGRRHLLRFGSLATALTGVSAMSALGATSAQAGPGDKAPPSAYVPVAEKGSPSGVASLDSNAKIFHAQIPDLSTKYVTQDGDHTLTGKKSFNGAGKLEFNHNFTPNYDTVLWIASEPRTNPTLNSQGLYIQHRVAGNLGGMVHDAGASELRLNGVTNTGAGQSAHEDSIVITGGVNDINLLTSSLANFHTSGTPTGEVRNLALFRATQSPPLPSGFTVGQAASMYLENQIIGETNFTLWAGVGDSVLATLRPKDKDSVGLGIKGLREQASDLFQIRNSSDTVLFAVAPAGTGRFGAGVGDGTPGTLVINNNNASASTVALRLKASQGQTGDLFQALRGDNTKVVSIDATGNLRAIGTSIQARNAADTITTVSLTSGGFRWNDSALVQTTVGTGGGAATLPASPTKYLRVIDPSGNTLVIPAYASS